jgi:sulfur-oxidizing protein SoxA
VQSLHVRFTECNRNAGVQPLKIGSKEYTDIEVFMTALSNGYPVAMPSTRD